MQDPIHRTTVRVRYAECDSMQFLHHARHIEYFELGRTDLIRSLGRSYGDYERDGVFLPVVELTIQYRKPARYDSELVIETEIASVTKLQVCFTNRIVAGPQREVLSEGTVRLACIDRNGKPQRIPVELLDRLRERVRAEANA